MNFTFVILHYLTHKDTIECVESILNNVLHEDYSILIVDNGSTNNSGQILHEKYDLNPKVYLIESKINLGFAKGNNLGYSYAKEKLKTDFVIMINNDTVITQNNFLSKIKSIYVEEKFDILGPDIISLIDNKHQNPYKVNVKKYSEKGIKSMIRTRYRNILFSYLYLYDIYLFIYKKIIRKHFNKYIKKIKKQNDRNSLYSENQRNIKLHGSCLIFSPDYLRKYKGLYSKTFMYLEEDILFYIAQKERLKLRYTPQIKIYHKEDSSTNALLNSNRNKRIFIYKHEIKSAKELLKIINDESVYKRNLIE
ncbi:glycosyltransferase family 2 protein [Desulfotomaculum defluvii]